MRCTLSRSLEPTCPAHSWARRTAPHSLEPCQGKPRTPTDLFIASASTEEPGSTPGSTVLLTIRFSAHVSCHHHAHHQSPLFICFEATAGSRPGVVLLREGALHCKAWPPPQSSPPCTDPAPCWNWAGYWPSVWPRLPLPHRPGHGHPDPNDPQLFSGVLGGGQQGGEEVGPPKICCKQGASLDLGRKLGASGSALGGGPDELSHLPLAGARVRARARAPASCRQRRLMQASATGSRAMAGGTESERGGRPGASMLPEPCATPRWGVSGGTWAGVCPLLPGAGGGSGSGSAAGDEQVDFCAGTRAAPAPRSSREGRGCDMGVARRSYGLGAGRGAEPPDVARAGSGGSRPGGRSPKRVGVAREGLRGTPS